MSWSLWDVLVSMFWFMLLFAWMAAQFRAMGLKLPYPKGVYRFKTHEEANEWEWNHMMEAAKKKFRERRNSQT